MVTRRTALAPDAHASMDDDALVQRFQQQSDMVALEELLGRYRRLARARARGYFLIGGDSDDVEQEALIGLYKAARDYRSSHLTSFKAFAELCVKRQIITAIKAATRQKHQPLNQYVSISAARPTGDGDEGSNDDLLVDLVETDPCDMFVAAEGLAHVEASVNAVLSGLEVEVLHLYAEGRSYQEIGEQLGRHTKSIDNALQRVKRKLDDRLGSEPIPA